VVFPRPEALPYLADAERFGLIYEKVRLLLRGEVPPLAKSVGRKVAKLIDEHVIALGIDPLIPPISITDAEFTEHVNRQASPRARASEMKHALRHHIRKHLQEDPVHYQKLSERLEEILATFGENWEQLSLALQSFVTEVQGGRQRQDDVDLDPATQAPFFDVLMAERAGEGPVPAEDRAWLAGLTVELVQHLQREIAIVGFWKNSHAQEVLRGNVFQFLDEHEIVSFERADAVADRLMELARANHPKLVSS
jgi:type I restriction enzyme R subunit